MTARVSHSREAGFTLLEMMVAIAVLAIALVAITSAQQSSLNNAFRVQRGQAAALMMRAIVQDIEEEYRLEGFPENSITDRSCEVPDVFQDQFDCRYDLERLSLQQADMQALVDQSFGGLLGDGGLDAAMRGDRSNLSGTMEGLVSGASSLASGMDMSGLAFLMPFFGPEGDALRALCNIDPMMLIMGFMGVQAFVPMVLEQVGERTRKLSVRVSWKEGPFGLREFGVTTYITALPEAALQELKSLEDAKEVLEGAMGPGGQGPAIPPGGSR